MIEEKKVEAQGKKDTEQKKLTKDDIVVYKPKTKNINFLGEWVLKLG